MAYVTGGGEQEHDRHCRCERRMMSIVAMIDAGTARTEISASSQLIESIITSTPMTVRIEVMSWVRLC